MPSVNIKWISQCFLQLTSDVYLCTNERSPALCEQVFADHGIGVFLQLKQFVQTIIIQWTRLIAATNILINFKLIIQLFSVSIFPYSIYPKIAAGKKSVCVTYFLWLTGGWFGLHHLYLGNDLQAFVWWATLGGYFGMGWAGEIFKIPEIVREANEDPAYIAKFVAVLQTNKKPPFSTSRFLFGIMVGYLWAQLLMLAIPQETFGGIDWGFLHWFVPLMGSLGKESCH